MRFPELKEPVSVPCFPLPVAFVMRVMGACPCLISRLFGRPQFAYNIDTLSFVYTCG